MPQRISITPHLGTHLDRHILPERLAHRLGPGRVCPRHRGLLSVEQKDALAVCGQPSLALGSPQQDTPRHIMTDTHFDYHPSPSLSHSATRAPRPVMGRQSTPAPQSPRGLINRTFYECQLEQSLLNKLFAVVPRNHHEF